MSGGSVTAAGAGATQADGQWAANPACKFPFASSGEMLFSPLSLANTCRENQERLDCSSFNTSLSLASENYLGDSEAAATSREGNALSLAFRQQFLVINMSGKYFT